MLFHRSTHLAALAGLTLAVSTAQAADVFYQLPFGSLNLPKESVPERDSKNDWRIRPEVKAAFAPYAVLDGPGTVYVRYPDSTSEPVPATFDKLAVVVRLPERRPITGSLFLPKPKLNGMVRLPFRVEPEPELETSEQAYHLAAQLHYRRLLELDAAGAAWFRHQHREAYRAQGHDPAELGGTADAAAGRRGLQDTYEIFSGGAAISENLQLDRRLLLRGEEGERSVPIDSLKGITVKAIDWKERLAQAPARVDVLARYVPHDQHLVLFPSFRAMLDVVDDVSRFGMPLASAIEPRAEDTQLLQRYRDQLCLETTGRSRLLGGKLVTSVALTGSDPYLRTGSDMAVLFECSDGLRATTLAGSIGAKQSAALEQPDVKPVAGKTSGLSYTGVASPDRRICSYLARWGNVVVVANSLAQLDRLQQVQAEKTDSLADLDEYRFFRQRYVPGAEGESAFLFLSDATIRRWCSARWRIGNSRRTQAAAALAELEARHLDQRVRGERPEGPIAFEFPIPELGRLELTSAGVRSSTYGTLRYMTPILELDLEKATQAEAQAYARWRGGYERNWRQYFDPIGVRLAVAPEKLSLDLTVMPLILGSDYRDWAFQLIGNAQIAPDAGDRHAGAVLHAAMAVDFDPKRELIGIVDSELKSICDGLENPLSCFGSSVAVYVDDDPFLDRLAAAHDPQAVIEAEGYRFPMAVEFEIRDHKKLDRLIEGIWKGAPLGAKHRERAGQVHAGHAYTSVSLEWPEDGDKFRFYYATPPGALILAWDEAVIRRALERHAARSKGEVQEARPWLGRHLALQGDARLIGLGDLAWGWGQNTAQLRSWSNLPILNEWKARYPDEDPVALHEKLWHVRLTCPGGGEYVWNEALQTMESTVYGSPAAPRGNDRRLALPDLQWLNLGVTFEDDGLRGRAEIRRRVKPSAATPSAAGR